MRPDSLQCAPSSGRLSVRTYECMYASRALSPRQPMAACAGMPGGDAQRRRPCGAKSVRGWRAPLRRGWDGMGWNGMGWEDVRRLAIRRTAARRASHARASTAGTRTAAPPAHASRPARRRRRRTPTGPPPPRPMARARRRSGRPSRGRRAGAPRTFWNEAALGALRLGDCGWITRRGLKRFGRFGAHI